MRIWAACLVSYETGRERKKKRDYSTLIVIRYITYCILRGIYCQKEHRRNIILVAKRLKTGSPAAVLHAQNSRKETIIWFTHLK